MTARNALGKVVTTGYLRERWRHFDLDEYRPVGGCTHEEVGCYPLIDVNNHNTHVPDELVCPACGGLLVLDEESVKNVPEGSAFTWMECPA